MYTFKEDINYKVHFWFDKQGVRNKKWARLPKASKAIYSVIMCHRNKHGIAIPSQETIAILSGTTEKTVRVGIDGLLTFPGFRVESYVTSRGHRAKKYITELPPREKGRAFPFFKSVITGGNWSRLKPSAQALYPVLRTFSFFDGEEYAVRIDDDREYYYNVDDMIGDGVFWEREFDFVDADDDILAEYAGIGINSLNSAISDLEEHFLIEKTEPIAGSRKTFKVFRTPPMRYTPEGMNRKIAKRNGNNHLNM
ncbi:MAG: helix-turn-helix domain-containing protein [Pseudomonadota bacterium]